MSLLSPESVLSALEELPLRDQIDIVERLVAEADVEALATGLSLCLMAVMLGVDDSTPPALRERLDRVVAKVAAVNAARLKADGAGDSGAA